MNNHINAVWNASAPVPIGTIGNLPAKNSTSFFSRSIRVAMAGARAGAEFCLRGLFLASVFPDGFAAVCRRRVAQIRVIAFAVLICFVGTEAFARMSDSMSLDGGYSGVKISEGIADHTASAGIMVETDLRVSLDGRESDMGLQYPDATELQPGSKEDLALVSDGIFQPAIEDADVSKKIPSSGSLANGNSIAGHAEDEPVTGGLSIFQKNGSRAQEASPIMLALAGQVEDVKEGGVLQLAGSSNIAATEVSSGEPDAIVSGASESATELVVSMDYHSTVRYGFYPTDGSNVRMLYRFAGTGPFGATIQVTTNYHQDEYAFDLQGRYTANIGQTVSDSREFQIHPAVQGKHGPLEVTIVEQPERFTTNSMADPRYSTNPLRVYFVSDSVPGITILPDSASVSEGSDAVFTVTAHPAPAVGNDKTVTVNLTQGSGDDFIAQSDMSPTVTLTNSNPSQKLSVVTDDDGKDELNGSITATIADSSAYIISPVNGSATMEVHDNDLPVVSISSVAASNGVTEGYPFEFTVFRDGVLTDALDVPVTLIRLGTGRANVDFQNSSGTENVGDALAFTVQIPAGSDSLTETISLNRAANVGPSDNVSIDVVVSSIATTFNRGTPGSVSVALKDNDVPTSSSPSMSVSGPDSVYEGEIAEFTVTASDASSAVMPDSEISVNFRVSEVVGNFLAADQGGDRSVTVPSNNSSAKFTVQTRLMTPNGVDGSFKIELMDGENYILPDSASTSRVSVSVINPATPFVRSIAGSSVEEGDTGTVNIPFTVILSEPVSVDFSLTWSVILESGDSAEAADFFGSVLPTGTISFQVPSAGVTRGTMSKFNVPVLGDTEIESDEIFTVVLSNPMSGGVTYDGILIPTGMKAKGTILRDDHYSIGLSTEVLTVNEGGSFNVKLTAEPKPPTGTTFSVSTLFVEPDGLAGVISPAQATIDDTGVAVVEVTASDNDFYSRGGLLTVGIGNGGEYRADARDGSSSVSVQVIEDESLPVVSLSTSASSVRVGETLNVTLTSQPPIGGGYSMLVDTLYVDKAGFLGTVSDVLFDGNGDVPVSTATAAVTLVDDHVNTSGTLTLKISNGTDYTAHSTENLVSVAVSGRSEFFVSLDYYESDDYPSLKYGLITPEVDKFAIQYRFSGIGIEGYGVNATSNYDIRHGWGLNSSYQTGLMAKNSREELFLGDLESAHDQHGPLVVTLVEKTGYITNGMANPKYATNPLTSYFVNADKPGMTIAPDSESVVEGTDAVFTVTSHPAPATGSSKTVTINLTQGANDDFIGQADRNPTVTLTSSNPSQKLTVKTAADQTDELSGEITATIAKSANYVVSPANGSASIEVMDNDDDTNVYEFSIDTDYNSVVAGADFEFTVHVSPSMVTAPVEDLTLTLDVSDGGTGILSAPPANIVIPARQTSAVGTISTNAISLSGSPKITVAPSVSDVPNRTADPDRGSIEVSVKSLDSPPEIFISGPSEPVEEGSPAQFIIGLSKEQDSDISVRYWITEITDRGSYLEQEVINELIRIPSGKRAVLLEAPTIDDALDEMDGIIRTMVVQGGGYAGSASAYADVLDNDGAEPIKVSVSALSGSVKEGRKAWFVFSQGTAASELKVGYELVVNGTVSNELPGFKEVTIPSGNSEVKVGISTIVDTFPEGDSDSLSIRILHPSEFVSNGLRSANYRKGDSDRATVNVHSLPILDLGLAGNFLTGAETVFDYRISFDTPSEQDTSVNYEVQHGSSWTAATPLSIPAGSPVFDFAVNAVGDGGQPLTNVRLVEGVGYQFSDAGPVAPPDLQPRADRPGISITGTNAGNMLEAGDAASFSLLATPNPSADIEVTVVATQGYGEDFINGTLTGGRLVETVTLTSAQNPKSFSIDTGKNTSGSSDGTITVSIQPSLSYLLDGISDSASVTVINNRKPIVSITGGGAVKEGIAAEFTLLADSPVAEDIEVALSISESEGGEFLPMRTEFVTISAGSRSAKLNVDTNDDGVVESAGLLIVSVLQDTETDESNRDYVPGIPGVATATVEDNDTSPPVISVSTTTPVLTEGTDTVFVFTASPALTADMELNLDLEIEGDYLDSSPTGSAYITDAGVNKISLSSGASSTFKVATVNDSDAELDGKISVRILQGEGYRVVAGSAKSAASKVADNDSKRIVLSAQSATATEGAAVVFTGAGRCPPNYDADCAVGETVMVEASDSPLDIVQRTGGSIAPQSLDLSGMNKTGTVQWNTVNDSAYSFDTVITAWIKPESIDGTVNLGYLDGSGETAMVTVNDTGDQNLSMLHAADGMVEEGENARFVVRKGRNYTSIPTGADWTLRLAVSGSEEYYSGAEESTVVWRDGGADFEILIPTIDDEVDGSDGTVTVTITGCSYQSSGAPVNCLPGFNDQRISASIIVKDNDEPLDVPVVSVTGGPSLIEGETAIFTVSTASNIDAPVAVRLDLSEEGGYLLAGFSESITLTSTEKSREFPVFTKFSSAREGNGSVTVTIMASPEYLIADDGRFATVSVLDAQSLPIVSIEAESISVEEGGTASFMLKSNRNLQSDLAVAVVADDVFGDFLTGPVTVPAQDATLASGTDQKRFSLRIEDDMVPEIDGRIGVSIRPGSSYVLGTPNAVEVSVTDAEAKLPTLGILSGRPQQESEDAEFVVISDMDLDPGTQLQVSFTPAEVSGGDYLTNVYQNMANPRTQSVTFNGRKGLLRIPIDDDSAGETSGRVRVALNGSSLYNLTSTARLQSAETVVYDNDSPELYIEGGPEVLEGDTAIAVFKVKAHTSPNSPITVHYTPTATGSGEILGTGVTSGTAYSRSLDFSGGRIEADLRINLAGDDTDILNNIVTVTLNSEATPGQTYWVDGSRNSASVLVSDNDANITKLRGGIVGRTITAREPVGGSGTIDVIVYSDPLNYRQSDDPGRTLKVYYTITKVSGGDYLADDVALGKSTPVYLTFEQGRIPLPNSYSATISLNLAANNDVVGEAGRYRLVIDEDPLVNDSYAVVKSLSSFNLIIYDNDAPELSVAAGSAVTEADGNSSQVATFTITSSLDNVTVPIRYSLLETQGDFLRTGSVTGTGLTRSLVFGRDVVARDLTFPLRIGNSESDPNGIITMILEADTSGSKHYTVNPTKASTTFTVIDNGSITPQLSISGPDSVFESDGVIPITVTAATDPKRALTANFTATQKGDFLGDSFIGTFSKTLAFASDGNGNHTSTLNLLLAPDDNGERSGEVKVTLNSDIADSPTYTLQGGLEPVSVKVMDSNVPELSLQSVSVPDENAPGGSGRLQTDIGNPLLQVDEGTRLTFNVAASFSPDRILTVRYLLEQQGIYLDVSEDEGVREAAVDFSGNATEGTIIVRLNPDDFQAGADGNLTLTLLNEIPFGSSYATERDKSSLQVRVNDKESQVSKIELNLSDFVDGNGVVISEETGILENAGTARMRIVSDAAPLSPVRVYYSMSANAGSMLLPADIQGKTRSQIVSFSLDDSNEYSGTLHLPFPDNSVAEFADNRLEVRLLDSNAYDIGGSSVDHLRIWDDDAPSLFIEAVGNTTEGDESIGTGHVQFKVRSQFPLNRTLRNVKFKVTETQDFLSSRIRKAGGTSMAVRFVKGVPFEFDVEFVDSKESMISVLVDDDDAAEPVDGEVTVELIADPSPFATYKRFSQTQSGIADMVEITVKDDDSLPMLGIATPSKSVWKENDGQVDFEIETAVDPGSALTVSYMPGNGGMSDFVDPMRNSAAYANSIQSIDLTFANTDSDNNFEAILPVHLHNDDVGESSGTITLALLSDPSRIDSYSVDSSRDRSAVIILDDDAPQLEIEAVESMADGTTEGLSHTANFRIFASGNFMPDWTGLNLRFTPAQTGDFLDLTDTAALGQTVSPDTVNTVPGSALEISNDGASAVLKIAIGNDETSEPDGSITVSLEEETVPNSAYSVSDANGSATILVIDDDSLPTLSFKAAGNPIEFDEPGASDADKHIRFFITSDSVENPGTVTVHYVPSQTGDWMDTASTRTPGNSADTPTERMVVFNGPEGGPYTGSLDIDIMADEIGEPTGSVRVALLADSGAAQYLLGDESETDKNSWTVRVFDNDEPELTISAPERFVEAADTTANLEFTVTARFDVAGVLNVAYAVSEFEPDDLVSPVSPFNFVGTAPASPHALDFNGTRTAVLRIPIAGDGIAEDNRIVKVGLAAGTGYTVSTDESAMTEVVDDDPLPTVTVAAPASVTESEGKIDFKLTSQSPATFTASFVVSEAVGNSGDFLTPATEQQTEETVRLVDMDPDGNYSDNVTVSWQPDNTADRTGKVTFTLNPSEDSYLLGAQSSASVKIYDDDSPEIHIISASDITEGDPTDANPVATDIKIGTRVLPNSWEGAPTEGVLLVSYSRVSEDYLADSVSGTTASMELEFEDTSPEKDGTGPFIATLQEPILSDTVAEPDGTVVITLQDESTPGTSYYVDAENSVATVNVTDDDSLPVLTITGPVDGTGALTGTVESDGKVVFKVSASRNPMAGAGLPIEFKPFNMDRGNFLSGAYPAEADGNVPYTLMFSDDGNGNFTADLEVLLEDDGVGESTSRIMTVLKPDPNGADRYKVVPANASATATVWDDDAPELSIEALGPVTESDSAKANFRVTAKARPSTGSIQLRFDATESDDPEAGEFIDRASLAHPYVLTFAPGAKTADIAVPVTNDGPVAEGDGSITVTLNEEPVPATSYTVSGEAGENRATVAVVDDDSLPILSISSSLPSGVKGVGESGTADFTISVRIPDGAARPATIPYRYRPSQTGDFIDTGNDGFTTGEDESGIITPPPSGSMFTQTLSVPLLDDPDTAERTGMVEVRLLPDDSAAARYALNGDGVGTSASMNVYDNDAPELYVIVKEENRSVVEVDPSDPQVSVTFTVRARVSPNRIVEVGYLPTEAGGSYLQVNGKQTAMLDFTNGATEADIPLAIGSNIVSGNNSTITLELLEELTPLTNYSVDSMNSSATVEVMDDETPPVLSIVPPDQPVLESGGEAVFTVKSSREPGKEINVNFTPASANYLTDTVNNVQVSESMDFARNSDGEYVHMIAIQLDNDDSPERTGTVTVTLNSPDDAIDYSLDGASPAHPSSAAVTVYDDEAPEIYILAAKSATEGEGAVAEFTVAARAQPNSPLTVNFTPLSGSYLAAGVSGSSLETDPPLAFSDPDGDGIFTSVLSVPIHNDTDTETQGSITLTLNEESAISSYSVDSAGASASAIIRDDDSLPMLSVIAPDSPALESTGMVSIEVELDMDPGKPVIVHYEPKNGAMSDFIPVTYNSQPYADTVLASRQGLVFADTDSDPNYEAMLHVFLDNDSAGESSGIITLNLVADIGDLKEYRIDPTASTVNVAVLDDDALELGITALESMSDGLTEGLAATADFRITASGGLLPDWSNLNLRFTPQQIGDYIDESDTSVLGQAVTADAINTLPGTSLEVEPDETSAILRIPISDDGEFEDIGMITVALEEEAVPYSSYSVLGMYGSAAIIVIDDDSLPVLSFNAAGNPSEFDEPAESDTESYIRYVITADSSDNPGTMRVRYVPTQEGDWIDMSGANSPISMRDFAAERMVTFNGPVGGPFTGNLDIGIEADSDGEPTGSVTVTLVDDIGAAQYRLADGSDAGGNSWTVRVFDNDEPELTISAPGKFLEASDSTMDLEFTVSARFNVPGSLNATFSVGEFDLDEPDTPVTPFNFLGTLSDSPYALEFNGTSTAALRIPIVGDDISESNRLVKVEFGEGTGYTFPVGESAMTEIVDDDSLPTISVSAPESVTESDGRIDFKLTSPSPGTFTALYRISEASGNAGDFLSPAVENLTEEQVTLTGPDRENNYVASIPISLENDASADRTGSVTLTLRPSETSYRLGSRTSASVRVYDDDSPEIFISGVEDVTEGDPTDAVPVEAVIRIGSHVLPNRGKGAPSEGRLLVRYSRVSNNFLADSVSGTSATVELEFMDASPDGSGKGPFVASLRQQLLSDTVAEPNGAVVITLQDETVPGSSYFVDAGNSMATVNVTDDDSLPVLTIAGPVDGAGAPSSTVESAERVVFKVRTSMLPDAERKLPIEFKPADVGSASFLSGSYPVDANSNVSYALMFRDTGGGVYEANLEVLLDNDETAERTGRIMAALKPDPNSSARYKVSSTDASAMATVLDDDAPELSIEGLGAVTESDNAMANFRVEAKVPPSTGTVHVSIHAVESSDPQAGEFIDLARLQNPYPLEFAPGAKAAILSVPVLNDGPDPEGNGSITVTLNEESPISAYTVDAAKDSASVIVMDDDSLPLLTVAAPDIATLESAVIAEFEVEMNMDPGKPVTIYFEPGNGPSSDFISPLLDSKPYLDTVVGSPFPLIFADIDADSNFEAMVPVILDNDKLGESSGTIVLKLHADPNVLKEYRIDPNSAASEAAMTILDDDSPQLEIEPAASATGGVTEGYAGTADFRVSTTGGIARNWEDVTFHYKLTQDGSFIDDSSSEISLGSGNSTVLDFSANRTWAVLSIPIANDSDKEPDGSITVELEEETIPHSNYSVSAVKGRATITVHDDDSLPLLTMEESRNPAEFDEPGNDPGSMRHMSFVVTATGITPPGNLLVEYIPTQEGDFIDGSDGLVVGQRNTRELAFTTSGEVHTANLDIPVEPDSNHESTGSVTVTLATDTTGINYRLGEVGSRSMTVKVYDNDAPELSVSTDEKEFVENQDTHINFTVSARFATGGTLNVKYIVEEFDVNDTNLEIPEESLIYADRAMNTAILDFTGSTDAVLAVEVPDDLKAEEEDRILRVSLVPEPGYTVASEGGGFATISVSDDDVPPTISLGGPDYVLESDGRIEFIASAQREPEGAITVAFTLAELGADFLTSAEESRSSATLNLTDENSDSVFTDMITVRLNSDSVGERTGEVTLVLKSNPASAVNYNLDENQVQKTVKVYDDDSPEIFITGGDTAVEGRDDAAEFTVTSIVMPGGSLAVAYMTESDNYLEAGMFGNEPQVENLTFTDSSAEGDGSGPFTAVLTVPLENDEAIEPDGHIQVTLIDANPAVASYSVDSERNSASVEVIDDDSLPVLSISGPEVLPESSGMATFSITAETYLNPGSGFSFEYTLSQSGDFLDTSHESILNSRTESTGLEFSGSNGTFAASLSFLLEDDTDPDETGWVAVTLNETVTGIPTYSVSEQNEHVVTLLDNDAPAIRIENTDGNAAEADGMVQFKLLSHILPATPRFTLAYMVEATGFNHLSQEESGRSTKVLTFEENSENGEISALLSIPLTDNDFQNELGAITVTLLPDDVNNPIKYMVDDGEPANSATVAVTDDDRLPYANITGMAESVTEGQDVEFTVQLLPAQMNSVNPVVVAISLHQEGDFIWQASPNSVSVPPSGSATLRIPTDDDMIDEENGSLTVTVVEGVGYEIGTAIRNKVEIEDNDTEDSEESRYSVASSVISHILQDAGNGNGSPLPEKPKQDLPEISIYAASGSIEEGGMASFSLEASKGAEDGLTINIALSEIGDFIEGNSVRTAGIATGESIGEMKVATTNDDLAEKDGSITATVINGEGYEVGSRNSAIVIVSDKADREARSLLVTEASHAVLSEMTGSLGARSLNTATQRVSSAFTESEGIKFKLGGNTSLRDFVRAGGDAVNDGMESWQEVLGDTSFEFGLFPEEGFANPANVWGIGDFRNFNSNDNAGGEMSGDVFTGHLGFDTLIGNNLVAGLTTSETRTELDYATTGDEMLSYNARTTGVHPYLGLATSTGSRLQVIAGYGLGEIGLDQNGNGTEMLESSFANFGVSGNQLLYSSRQYHGGTSELSVEGESWLASQFLKRKSGALGNLRTDARHLRISTVGSHRHELESGTTVNPSISLGLREDGKLGDSFLGMELGGGIGFANRYGYEISTKGEVLFDGADQIQEWGLSGKLSYDAGKDGLGVQLNAVPEWGRTMLTNDNALWGNGVLVQDFNSNMNTNGALLNADIGYGLAVWQDLGILNSYGGIFLSETQDDQFRIGTKLTIGEDFEFGLEGSQTLPDEGSSGSDFRLEGNLRW